MWPPAGERDVWGPLLLPPRMKRMKMDGWMVEWIVNCIFRCEIKRGFFNYITHAAERRRNAVSASLGVAGKELTQTLQNAQ